MQLLERVREIGADEARVSDDNVRLARQALTREMARDSRQHAVRRSRRRTWAGIGVGGLIAGTAVTAIVVGSVLAPPTGANAQAAEVFEEAARVTLRAVDTALMPGQYLRIEEQGEWLQFWSAEWAEDEDENTFAFNAGRDGAETALLVQETRVLYVPADRTGDWFYGWGVKDVVATFGARGDQASADWTSSEAGSIRESGTIETLPGGEFLAADGDEPPEPYLADSYRPHYAEMPRDPEKLLDWLRARSGMSDTEADRWIVAGLSSPSAINLMPADLRAAFFRAIALIPGFEVRSRDEGLVTLEYAVPWHRTTKIVIDTVEGFVESISESYGSGGVAGDTPESLTRVKITIVDSVP